MKNKLSFSLIAVTLSCAIAFVVHAAGTESEEDLVNMELSEAELKTITEECTAIAVENDMQGEELITYVDECFAASTMIMDEATLEGEELAAEDQEIPVLEDETDTDSEEPVIENEEESSTATS